MVTSKSSSTVAVVDTGEHLFKVVGYSQVQGNGAVMSGTFRVGGHDWAIVFYPNGEPSVADAQFTSAYLQLVSTIESDVMASFCLCLLQDPASPATGGEKHKKSYTRKFLPSMTDEDNRSCWGHKKFMSKDALAASGCLQDDCLVIKCTLEITKLIEEEDDDDRKISTIIVPPANLSADFGNLLETGHKADLTVNVGKSSKQSFKVHTSVVGARSPALLAQLRGGGGSMIEDMDAKVFEVLLHYIYKDRLPGFMEEDTEEATSMTRDLLVPAHGCGIERLRVMCESRLSRSLDVNNVSSTLDLAEQYGCDELKECCLKYMATDGERLRIISGTKGFEQLVKNRPHVVRDILNKVIIDKPKSQAVTTPAPAAAQ